MPLNVLVPLLHQKLMSAVKSGALSRMAPVQSALVNWVDPPTALPPEMEMLMDSTLALIDVELRFSADPLGTTVSSQVKVPVPVSPPSPEILNVCCKTAAEAVPANAVSSNAAASNRR